MSNRQNRNASLSTGFSVITPNLKYRLSGVTMTINRLVPLQAKYIDIVATGPGLAENIPHISLWRVFCLSRRRQGASVWRIWHARRNTEMLLGLILKNIFRKKLKLLFTSASQRHHSHYTRWLISKMDGVIATSDRTEAYLQHPAKVIRHGINIQDFTPILDKSDRAALRQALNIPVDHIVIGCAGRIRAQKGTDIFVDSVIKLMAIYPKVSAVILGRTTKAHEPFLRELMARVAKAGFGDRCHFRGEVTNAVDLANWYRTFDFFIAPQRWEGFGLTPLEAMASGTPVIATRVGAFEELVVDGVTGRLVDVEDVESMVEAAKAYIDDPAYLEQASVASRRHVETHFDIEQEACALVDYYHELLHA